MTNKHFISLILSATMTVSLLFAQLTNISVYAAEEISETVEENNQIDADDNLDQIVNDNEEDLDNSVEEADLTNAQENTVSDEENVDDDNQNDINEETQIDNEDMLEEAPSEHDQVEEDSDDSGESEELLPDDMGTSETSNIGTEAASEDQNSTDENINIDSITPISECSFSGLSTLTYTGKELTPSITIQNGDEMLVTDKDYTVEFENNINAGIAKVIVTGQGLYSGTVEKTFKIASKKVTPAVTISNKVLTYNGQNRMPSVSVKYGNVVLKRNQDYTVRYATKCSNVGTYNAVVTLKGNYAGSNKASYKIIPKTPRIYSVVDSNSKFDVKLYRQTEQTTGYQIQYSLNSSFASGNKSVTIGKYNTTEKTITKPETGKTYYVRVRAFKKAGANTYYSSWSKATSTVVKRSFKSKSVYTLNAGEATSFTITLSNRMMIAMAFRFDAKENISNGGIRIIAKDKNGKAVQSDYFDFKGCKKDYGWENWCWSGVNGKDEYGLFLPPGEYKYTIKNTSDGDIKLNYSVIGYVKMAETASFSNSKTVIKGEWVKIGKIGEGVPYTDISLGDNGVVDNLYIDASKNIWVYGNKLGTANVSVKLRNGKQYITKVIVKGSNPNFMAYLYEYNTRDNYFTVKVKNLRGSDLVIIRNGAKVEDVDYKSYDRWLKSDGNVTVKFGETKYIRFYVNGSTTWPNYKDYTLFAKIRFEDETYDWHVWYNDSTFWKNGGWYKTYWDDDKYAQWY